MEQIPSNYPCVCGHKKLDHHLVEQDDYIEAWCTACAFNLVSYEIHRFKGDNLKYLESKLD